MAKMYNRVPEGRVGTGEAYVLPKSRAFETLLDSIEYNQKMGLLNIQRQQADATKTNKDFLDNQLKAKRGILYQDELNGLSQKWVDKGAQYRAKGFNPFEPNVNDPNQVKASQEYLNEKAMIEGMAETRDLYQKNFLDQQQEYQKGNADEDSWVALNDFYTKGSLQDLYNTGTMPPTLQKRVDLKEDLLKRASNASIKDNVLDPNTNIETKRIYANEDAIATSIVGMIDSDPRLKRQFNKQYGVDESKAPAKMILGLRDPFEVNTTLDKYYRSSAGTKEALKAFPPGTVISYTSPEYQKFLNEKTNEQLKVEQAYENGLNDLVAQRVADVNTENEKRYNFDLENQQIKREDQGMQKTMFGLDKKIKQNTLADREEKKTAENIRDMNIQGIQTGSREAMVQLRDLAKSKGGTAYFDKEGKLNVKWNDRSGTKTIPREYKIDLSLKKEDGYAQINEILTDLTGKKVDIETLQGKDSYSGGLVDVGQFSISKTQIEKLRSTYEKDFKSLGDDLMKAGHFKTTKEAYEAAAEILDKTGKIHKVVTIQKPK